jgi:aspartate aminotransferase
MSIASVPPAIDFGDPGRLDRALSAFSHSLRPSGVLKIAAEVQGLIAAGRPVCNLTVGDFDPAQFPIPERLRSLVADALAGGETNYPPAAGLLSLRQAVTEYIARDYGVGYPVESVVITSGGRPAIYAAYRCLVDPGDTVLYSVPSWNNDHYVGFVGARAERAVTSQEGGFQPTVQDLAPRLSRAALLCLCSPNNPTGTTLDPKVLREILLAVVEENDGRSASGKRPLFVLHDLMYGSLVFGGAAHPHPLALVPEMAPWLVTVDGISKAFAGTGLRVGWAVGAPATIARMKEFLSHVGAWAPRPEQVATASFLRDAHAIAEFRVSMELALTARLDTLYEGFCALREEGYPVDCIRPQGAIYLSLRLNLVGREVAGVTIQDNEAIRTVLLERAGVAVVPFQAFGFPGESGWFRLSAGAVSLEDIRGAMQRIKALLALMARPAESIGVL